MAAGDLVVADYQVELRTTLTGARTPFQIGPDGITGLGEPPVKSGSDSSLGHADGSYQGRHYTEPRVITVDYSIKGTPAQAGARLKLLKTMWAKSEATALPLHLRLPGLGKMVVTGRPTALVEDTTLLKFGFVRALATFECGDPAITADVELPEAPAAPFAASGDTVATVIWNPPEWDGGSPITDYLVSRYRTSDGVLLGTASAGTTLRAVDFSSTNGTQVHFTVAAINAMGTGPASPISNNVTPTAGGSPAPDAPTIGLASPGPGQATIRWSAPAGIGGSAIVAYRVVVYLAGTSTVVVSTGAPPTARELVVTGLATGTAVHFKVTAQNNASQGSQSAASNSVTPT